MSYPRIYESDEISCTYHHSQLFKHRCWFYKKFSQISWTCAAVYLEISINSKFLFQLVNFRIERIVRINFNVRLDSERLHVSQVIHNDDIYY